VSKLDFAAVRTKIMIIRHGEKPGKPIDAPGIDENGKPDPNSLTAAGWQRARALVTLFHPAAGISIRTGLATPDHLFAADITDPDSSKRPVETLTPLANSFSPARDIDASINASETEKLAEVAAGVGGVVLVAWKHEHILKIAETLAPESKLPGTWPPTCFDIVFVFDKNAHGAYDFSQVAERVLPTDTTTPLQLDP
jgi:broad specificity phosphatase PhoE